VYISAADENGTYICIAAPHYEGASLYAFDVIAVLDSTMFSQPARTARIALDHLQARIKGVPF
jgi:hypothetical protein